jgi:hypothetical protein
VIHRDLHLRRYVIRPVLDEIEQAHGIRAKDSAEELLVLTAATESHGGKWLHQNGGPACGIYQMEPRTADDLIERIVRKFEGKLSKTGNIALAAHNFNDLDKEICGNIRVATYLARMYYWFVPEPLPYLVDTPALARYWKQYWNTKGAVAKAIDDYRKYLDGNI